MYRRLLGSRLLGSYFLINMHRELGLQLAS
jgi:hypothetical protein